MSHAEKITKYQGFLDDFECEIHCLFAHAIESLNDLDKKMRWLETDADIVEMFSSELKKRNQTHNQIKVKLQELLNIQIE